METIQLPFEKHSFAIASAGTKVLFAGGSNYGAYAYTATVSIYDQAQNTWSTTQLSQAKAYMAGAAIGDKVYIGGGYGYDSSTPYSGNLGFSKKVDIYDASTQNWSYEELSIERRLLSAIALGDKVFFAGGENALGISSVVDIYNQTTGTWTTKNLSQPRKGMAVAALGSKV